MKTTRQLIAEELRSIRAKKDLSIEMVAQKSKVNKDTISRYENNLVSMQIDTLEKILNVYEEDFDIFFKRIYVNKQNSLNEKE